MSQTVRDMLSTAAPWLLLLIGTVSATWFDPYIDRKSRRRYLLIAALVLLLMAAEATDYALSKTGAQDGLRALACAVGYAVRPALLGLFLRMLLPEQKQLPVWILTGLNAAVSFLSIWTGTVFTVRNNQLHRGPLEAMSLILCGLLIAGLAIRLVRFASRGNRKQAALILSVPGCILAAGMTDGLSTRLLPIRFLTMALIASLVFYSLWLHQLFSRRHEEEMLENLRAEHRIQLMVSQIQPHFLFNTLSTIQALCRADPEKAFVLVERFGQFLRENLAFLERVDLIPFEQEMSHTRTYVEIEQVRFPSIHIAYELQDTQFSVPVLTVQPLVENAIRHGVRIRKNGQILVRSWREKDAHVVSIRDNGKGFDVEAALALDNGHIGLRNVRSRVEQMCGGSMEIESRIGEGATVILRFPAGGEEA